MKAGDYFVKADVAEKGVTLGSAAQAQIKLAEKEITLFADDIFLKDNAGTAMFAGSKAGGIKISGKTVKIN